MRGYSSLKPTKHVESRTEFYKMRGYSSLKPTKHGLFLKNCDDT